ncbi:hypothetical protein CHS0354_000778 [Potamilus streckersoni]|uniref:ATP-grasp domain-containing protein n=1 Tax=Potamilus streckersoni TaxID=2493646 RepID=A0AAE0T894_9BIVA|nr:hypothetical protein CHS0354_000778 [Potamilus streckersoni]
MNVGILGGGQLAKMSALAAYRMGIDVSFYEKNEDAPALRIAKYVTLGEWNDIKKLEKFARGVDVITLENEFIDTEIIETIEGFGKKVFPTSHSIKQIQDKFVQKLTLIEAKLPVASFSEIRNTAEGKGFGQMFGFPYLLKARKNSYDGYGNKTIHEAGDLKNYMHELGYPNRKLFAEQFIHYEKELATIVAKNERGEMCVFPVVETVQKNHICSLVKAPADISPDVQKKVWEMAIQTMNAIKCTGVLAIEFFLTKDGELLINELAQRPHNSGHYSLEACNMSQFEAHIRSVVNQPLKPITMTQPCAVMVNLLGKGDVTISSIFTTQRHPNATLHVYGKKESRRGRKMGHITVIGKSMEECVHEALRLQSDVFIATLTRIYSFMEDKTERKNIDKKPMFMLIEISVFWKTIKDNKEIEQHLTVKLRYNTPLSIYAIPECGFEIFNTLIEDKNFPHIVYVPPFSGLEPVEKWLDDGNVKQNVGKGQPGSVLRNLLYRVIDVKDKNGNTVSPKENKNWKEIQDKINDWFGVLIMPPKYEKGQSTQISLNYSVNKKEFDIISGGSGFHQILTLMAFFYGYKEVSTILFDEPDAHLHVNLQRQILSYFKQKKQIQFLIATHSEEFIRGVEVNSIISMLSETPQRISSSEPVVKAMSIVENNDVIQTKQSPFILYVEGEDDVRILTTWAEQLDKTDIIKQFLFHKMGGTSKKAMDDKQNEHFKALRKIIPNLTRVVLFDYDSKESFHPEEKNPAIKEWKRKNIENYLLVPDAWKAAILDATNSNKYSLFNSHYQKIVDDFFNEQNLTLPPNSNWNNVKANVFQLVDGKKILFENPDSLFQIINSELGIAVNREKVAGNMTKDTIHNDIIEFFDFLQRQLLHAKQIM